MNKLEEKFISSSLEALLIRKNYTFLQKYGWSLSTKETNFEDKINHKRNMVYNDTYLRLKILKMSLVVFRLTCADEG